MAGGAVHYGRTGFGLAAFCLFGPSQCENLTWGFQTCFVLPGLFATLSFVGLLLYWMRSEPSSGGWASWKYLLLSIAAALGATYSLSNGNVVWPLLVAAALLLRLRRVVVLSLVITGAVSTALYLHGYTRLRSIGLSPGTLVTLFKYVTAYFGSSFVLTTNDVFHLPASSIRRAELIGIVGLIVAFLLLLRLPSHVRSHSALSVQLALTLLFCVGTGVVTAVGRFFLGVGQAFASRYQTVALLFWCCMALLLLAEYLSSPHTKQSAALLHSQVILLAIMLVTAHLGQSPLTRARLQGFQRNVAAMALVTDVPDAVQLLWADYHPEDVLSLVPYMRKERLSVFAGMQPSLLGKPLDSMFDVTSLSECLGQVESVTEVAGVWPRSLRITGWAWDYKQRRTPSGIVATANDIITGLGVVGGWRPAVRGANPKVTTNYSGFTGYVRNVPPSDPVKIYAILHGNPASACLIATAK